MTSFFTTLLLTVLGFIAMTSGKEQFLMFSGGAVRRGSRNVTLISLDGSPPVPECVQNIKPHPRLLASPCSATIGDGEWKTLSHLSVA